MADKDYTYAEELCVENGKHIWVLLKVISERKDLDAIHQRKSVGWVCLTEAYDSKAVWSPSDDDKYLPVENAVYALDKAAKSLTESNPINTKDIYGYLKDKLHNKLLEGLDRDHITISCNELRHRFSQYEIDDLVKNHTIEENPYDSCGSFYVTLSLLDGTCITRKTHKFEYSYFDEEDD